MRAAPGHGEGRWDPAGPAGTGPRRVPEGSGAAPSSLRPGERADPQLHRFEAAGPLPCAPRPAPPCPAGSGLRPPRLELSVRRVTMKVVNLKQAILQAWKERWSDYQWAINMKRFFPRGATWDILNLAGRGEAGGFPLLTGHTGVFWGSPRGYWGVVPSVLSFGVQTGVSWGSLLHFGPPFPHHFSRQNPHSQPCQPILSYSPSLFPPRRLSFGIIRFFFPMGVFRAQHSLAFGTRSGFELSQERIRSESRRTFFPERVVRRWNRLWWSYHVDVAPGDLS